MGKVGSTTIVRSLKASGLAMPIYHVHDLTRSTLDRDEKLYKRKFDSDGYWPINLWESQYLLKQIERGVKRKKWKIVTVTRDPIARNISGFFQTLRLEFGFDYQNIKSMKSEEIIEELIAIFLEKVRWHEYPLTWFDVELKGVFGIDVFASDFPIEKGYEIYKGEHGDALVLRLENLNECAQDAFKEFLNIDGFTLIEGNISSEKAYYPIYQKFLDSVVLPDFYVRRMYTSKYARHFYSEEEITKFKAKWSKAGIM